MLPDFPDFPDDDALEPLPALPSLPPLPPVGEDEEVVGADVGGIEIDAGEEETLDLDDAVGGDTLLSAASLLDTDFEGSVLGVAGEADPELDIGDPVAEEAAEGAAEYGWTRDNEASHELDVMHDAIGELADLEGGVGGEELGVDDFGHDEIDLPRLGLALDDADEDADELDLGDDGMVSYDDGKSPPANASRRGESP